MIITVKPSNEKQEQTLNKPASIKVSYRFTNFFSIDTMKQVKAFNYVRMTNSDH